MAFFSPPPPLLAFVVVVVAISCIPHHPPSSASAFVIVVGHHRGGGGGRSSSRYYNPSSLSVAVAAVNSNDDDIDDIGSRKKKKYATIEYDELISWFLSHDVNSYVNPKIDIRPSTRGGLYTGGYGAFATSDLDEDEVLLRVPRACCVTLDDALSDVECGLGFRKLMDDAGPGADTVVIAGYLAKEYLLLKEYDRRLEEGNNDDDDDNAVVETTVKFAPYLRTLPWERGVNAQEHVLFWEDGDVEALLGGSLAYADAVETRATVKMATGIIDGIIGPVVRRARGEVGGNVGGGDGGGGGFRFPWQRSREEEERDVAGGGETILDGLEEAVRGAFVICLSRAFVAPSTVDGGREEDRLEPVFDMLQHSNVPNIRHRFVDDGSIEVTAGPNVRSGDELFNRYQGEEDGDSMPYHKFFTRFGFVPGVTEPVANLIAERSTIFFPQRAVV